MIDGTLCENAFPLSYAVKRIAARHLRALLHYHYPYNSYDKIKRLRKLQKHNDLSYIEKDLNNAIFYCKYINAEIGIKNPLMMNNEYIRKLYSDVRRINS